MVVTPIHPESEHPTKQSERERERERERRKRDSVCVCVVFGAAMTSFQPRTPFQTTGSTDLAKSSVTPERFL